VFSLPERPPRPASSARSSAKSSAKSKATSQKSSARRIPSSRTICSSDDQEFSDADADSVTGSASGYQSTGSVAARSVKSTASTESHQSVVPLNIEKELLAAIEASGGFYSFPHGKAQALDKLLNDSEHQDEDGGNPFGKRGDKVRRKYCRRINYILNN